MKRRSVLGASAGHKPHDRDPHGPIPYRWVIVAVGALMTCVAVGTMFSLAVFLEPMSTATGWSRAGISSAMTLNFLVMGLGGFAWGAASDRYGPRIVVLIGAVLLGLALVLASRAHVAHRHSSSPTAFWSASRPAPSSRR